MKKLNKIISIIAAGILIVSPSTVVTAQTYADVQETHWAYTAIERCTQRGWFDGYTDGTFKPEGEILRGEAVKVLVTVLGVPINESTESHYYDVNTNAWYTPYIEVGNVLFPKVTDADGRNIFQPEKPVTREDVIYALIIALGYDKNIENADESILNMFYDQDTISPDMRPYAALAINYGIVNGYDDGTIRAKDSVTRAEFAHLLTHLTTTCCAPENKKLIAKIELYPDGMEHLTVGDSFEFTASAAYTDGTVEIYSDRLNPYTEGAEGIIVINKNKVTAIGEGIVIIKFNNENLTDKAVVVDVQPNYVLSEPKPTSTPKSESIVTPIPVQTPIPKPEINLTEYRRQVVELVNIERAKEGKSALKEDNTLDKCAQQHSEDMAQNGFFDHTNLKGETPFDRMKNHSILYMAAAENIAYGVPSPESVVEMWMNSEGHRKNILSDSYNKIGVGIAENLYGVLYWTQNFTD